jgi:hypothetical protein
MNRIIVLLMLWSVGYSGVQAPIAAEQAQDVENAQRTTKYADYQALVAETHKKSLAARETSLRNTVKLDKYWIGGGWGTTIWSLAALYTNKKVDEANARLLKEAKAYLADNAKSGKAKWPWDYFGIGDYVRILCLFHANSPHFPGRLKPETEAAMKEVLWIRVKQKPIENASLDQLFVLQGTENHDLTKRPNDYLVASVLKDDPQYKNRRYDDGHTAQEHFDTWSTYFREWPRKRAMTGLWVEMGSGTYQKYSWPALFNLHELSPDPVIRKRFGMLLDLAFIEEAQVSIQGRRGGGGSRTSYGYNNFEYYKNLLYAPEGIPAHASHTKILETSRYQLPAAAILLRTIEFPAQKPFLITNRVLGEIAHASTEGSGRLLEDSALVNYAWRTPHYLFGCTLQNPSLSYPDPETGKPVLKYPGISRQQRFGSMLFHDPHARHPVVPANKMRDDNEMCAIYPKVKQTRGGRSQHSFWTFQHRNVQLLQRIGSQRDGVGSYSTGYLSVRFHGKKLARVEKGGWIFASNGKAFAGVKFLDHIWHWGEINNDVIILDKKDSQEEEAVPFIWVVENESVDELDLEEKTRIPIACLDSQCTSRILIHAGDIDTDGSFETFISAVLENPLTVKPEKVEYRAGSEGPLLEFFRYDVKNPTSFTLPQAGGKTVNLRPEATYSSPYLNGKFGSDRITVTVGPIEQVYDFGKSTVTRVGTD